MIDKRRQRGTIVALAAGAGGALLSFGSGHAQTTAPRIPSGEGQKRLAIDVIGDILYDSNIARGQNQVANVRRLDKSEVTYTPSVRVSSYLPLGRNLVYLSASGGYEFHQHNTTLNSPRADVTGGTVLGFGRCSLALNGGYSMSQSDQADLPLQIVRNQETTLSGGLQTNCGVGSGIVGFAGAQVSSTSNSAHISLVDSSEVSFNGGIGYENHRLGSVQVIGSFSRTWYDENRNLLLLSQPGYETWSAGLQFSRPIGHRLNGSASIGYQEARSRDALGTSTSTVYGSGALDYRVNSRLGLSLAYHRSAAPATIQGFDYVVHSSVELSGRYALSSRLRTSFGVVWDKEDSKGRGPLLATSPASDRTRTLNAGVTYDLGRTLSTSLNVSQENRNADPNIFDYTAYEVAAKVTKSF
jgi:hypothetical protein